jgi:predicted small metal-binding protein
MVARTPDAARLVAAAAAVAAAWALLGRWLGLPFPDQPVRWSPSAEPTVVAADERSASRPRRSSTGSSQSCDSPAANRRGEGTSMRELNCRDVGFDCNEVIRGETDEEVMAQAATHARDAHGMNEIDQETGARIQSLIHDA